MNNSSIDVQTQSPFGAYTDNSSTGRRKAYYAVYATDVQVTYDANGGTGAPSAQTQTAKVNGYEVGSKAYFTISSTTPVNTNGCKYFLGWSTDKNATSAQYTAGKSSVEFKTNTTLYAVWENHHDGDGDDICDLCQTALTAPTTVNGVYQISNKNQLIWFMQYVNAGNKSASAVLTADIDMDGYAWTPIASTASYHESGATVTDTGYTGIFDGAGHVIKNFTVTGGEGDGSSSASGNVKSYGLFGTVSGTVKNLGIDGYTFNVGTADCRAGAIVGQLVTGGRIEDCYVINSKVLTGTRIAGAIAGCNYGGTIDSCFVYNCEVTGHSRCAAVVGDTKDDGGDKIGTVINCYADKAPVGSQNGGSSYVQNCATVTAEQIASGEVTYALNGNTSDGVWKQTVGTGLPSFSGDTVYYVYRCDGQTPIYSNESTNPQAHTYGSDNFCTFCGSMNTAAVASVSKNGVVTGAYTTLNDAIQAVANCTDADKAVVTIHKNIAQGNSYQKITSGVFTIDLGGFEISSTHANWGALYISGADIHVTIQDTVGNGKITGNYAGIRMFGEVMVTITGGTISGKYGVHAQSGSTATISGGTISGGTYGVYAESNSTATVSGGTISGGQDGVYAKSDSTATISGGTISGGDFGVSTSSGSTATISGGEISGDTVGVYPHNGTATISGGSISGGEYGMFASGSGVTISDCEISGGEYGVGASDSSMTISDCEISGGKYGVDAFRSSVTISGGTISGDAIDINTYDSSITLTLSEDGVGTTFPGGITVWKTTLNDILGEGMAYWRGNTVIHPADDATEITGDVTIKAACKHTDATYTNNGDDHTVVCSGCNNTLTEGHSYTNCVCACGAVSPDAVAAVVSGDGVQYFATFAEAVSAWGDGTTLQLLQNVEHSETITVTGKRVLDLNGKVINCQISDSGTWFDLFYNEGDLTVIDSAENGTITLRGTNQAAIIKSVGDLTIAGGHIDGQHWGVYCEGGTLNISGGTVSATYAVSLTNTEATVNNGKIQGNHITVNVYDGASLELTGGEIIGNGGEAIQVGQNAKSVIISGGSISAISHGLVCYGNVTITDDVVIDAGFADFQFSSSFLDARLIIGCQLADGTYTVRMDTPGAFAVAGEGITLNPKAFIAYNENCKIVEDEAGLSMVLCDHTGGAAADGTCLGCGKVAQFNVLVDNVIITTANMSDVLGDGTVSYDPATKTLTLNNANIENAVYYQDDTAFGVGILAQEDLNIRLVGDNFLSTIDSEYMGMAILCYGNLTITGNGTLNAQCGQAQEMRGVMVYESFTVEAGAAVTVNDFTQCDTYSIQGQFNGIFMVGFGPYDYVVYGNAVLDKDLTVNGNNDTTTLEHIGEFTIEEGATLTISDGVTLTIADNSELASAEVNNILTNKGKVILEGTGTIVNLGVGICTETATHCFDSESECLICGYICTHSWLDATCTAPKTCSKCGATEGEPTGLHIDENNNGRCDTCNCLMRPAKLVMATMSLEGNIGINYYMLLSDAVINDADAFMQFTLVDGTVLNVPISEGIPTQVGEETLYLFTCKVDAKEMSDDVLAQCFYTGGSTQVYTYSVKAYCDYILNNSGDEALKDLVKKMLNYGGASQNYFEYNTDDLANAGLEVPNYDEIVIDGFSAQAGQGTELSKFYAASLILKSETTLRFFFNGEITATYNGEALEVGQRSGLYYVDVTGIAAADLDEEITITIFDGTSSADITFNPMAYCQGVFKNTDDQQLKDLVAALYLYNQAANNYFEEV